MQRAILHMDLDTFFVSVERLKNPQLVGLPVIVGGQERGVVAACSYEARKFGVHSAMASVKARKLCPQAVWLKGDMAAYSYYSNKVTQIIADTVPVFEKASVDEFYIDLTGMDRFFGVQDYATELRSRIMKETGLPISMALSTSKTVSKIATDEAKPCGQLFIEEGKEKEFLAPLAINKLPMVGENTCTFLVKRGIKTIGDLAAVPLEVLENLLGKHGTSLWEKANGICNRQVESSYSRKSISQETTFFEDVNDKDHLLGVLSAMTEKLCYKIRTANMVSSCVAIKFRYPDFSTHTQQLAIRPTNSDTIIAAAVKTLFQMIHHNEKLRLIGVRLGNLSFEKSQLNLFGNAEKEIQKLKAIDSIRNKYGWTSVVNASSTTSFR